MPQCVGSFGIPVVRSKGDARNADAPDEIVEPRIAAQLVELGIDLEARARSQRTRHCSVALAWREPLLIQPRRARRGSVRVARQAGRTHAARAAIVITTNADPKAIGSRGLTR